MKKLLGIVVLGILICNNSFAGWFSKLPILKCEIIHDRKSYGTKFYNLEDDYEMASDKPADHVVFKPTKRYYKFHDSVQTNDGWHYNIRHTVDRYSGQLLGSISEYWRVGDADGLRKALSTAKTFIGTCEEI